MKKKSLISMFLVLVLCLASCGSGSKKKDAEAVKPLEIKEFGYSMNNEYIYVSVILHNPNEKIAVEYPSFRVTARDADGTVLGTEDQTLSIIYPGQDFVYAGQMCKVDQTPAKVDVEPLKIKHALDVSTLEHPQFTQLKPVRCAHRGDRFVGEIQNDNDYDIDDAIVTIIFRDDDGNLIGGTDTFIEDLSAGSSTPFDTLDYIKFDTQNIEFFANIW
jgi:hypothetical protein